MSGRVETDARALTAGEGILWAEGAGWWWWWVGGSGSRSCHKQLKGKLAKIDWGGGCASLCGCVNKPCADYQEWLNSLIVYVCRLCGPACTTLTFSIHTPEPSSGAQRIMVLSIEAESKQRRCCSSPPAGGDREIYFQERHGDQKIA